MHCNPPLLLMNALSCKGIPAKIIKLNTTVGSKSETSFDIQRYFKYFWHWIFIFNILSMNNSSFFAHSPTSCQESINSWVCSIRTSSSISAQATWMCKPCGHRMWGLEFTGFPNRLLQIGTESKLFDYVCFFGYKCSGLRTNLTICVGAATLTLKYFPWAPKRLSVSGNWR